MEAISTPDYARHIARTLNAVGQQASRLALPAGVSNKLRIAWAQLRLAFDHATAITSLFHYHDSELAGPAFALLRPMNDALKRGTWMAFCATDTETQTFIDSDKLPKRNLAQEIEQHAPFDQFPMFTKQYEAAWDKFHSFTHTGIQMVGAYTLGHGIGPAFPEQDIRMVLDHSEAVASMVVQVMVMIAGDFDPDLADEVLNRIKEVQPARERLTVA
ncbi:hypothetical protein [Xanthomonas sp. 3307]|uniref:DUF6988 family protein n=1 Tax=Xanthomonas sp. 3307 TaxID=3035316 RepID=UPI00161A36BE|nr:hypothetical protein [Xanthomonas sp. 3307]MBB5940790.1 hypothetical protein [Xanthomonas sp. 3307]